MATKLIVLLSFTLVVANRLRREDQSESRPDCSGSRSDCNESSETNGESNPSFDESCNDLTSKRTAFRIFTCTNYDSKACII